MVLRNVFGFSAPICYMSYLNDARKSPAYTTATLKGDKPIGETMVSSHRANSGRHQLELVLLEFLKISYCAMLLYRKSWYCIMEIGRTLTVGVGINKRKIARKQYLLAGKESVSNVTRQMRTIRLKRYSTWLFLSRYVSITWRMMYACLSSIRSNLVIYGGEDI